MRGALSDYPRVEVSSRAEWRAWLESHHRRTTGIWLVTYKAADARYVSYADVVEEALCFGWIDSLPRKLDAARTMLLVSPRRAGSAWSKVNKDRVEGLLARGLMMPAGLDRVATAKCDGSWAKLDLVDALVIPDDLAAALAALPLASAHWDAFPPSIRRGILEWIEQAKRPETRAERVRATAEGAAENRRANQWR